MNIREKTKSLTDKLVKPAIFGLLLGSALGVPTAMRMRYGEPNYYEETEQDRIKSTISGYASWVGMLGFVGSISYSQSHANAFRKEIIYALAICNTASLIYEGSKYIFSKINKRQRK